jgi:parafibromin
MKDTNAPPNAFRKTSADHPSQPSSLELEPSFFLRRRKTNRSSGNLHDFEPVSPQFGATRVAQWPTQKSGSSNKSHNLEIKASSVGSSLSLGSKFPLNVSDWNEKVQQERKSGVEEFPPRHTSDPPRPPREGFEWVWFPEGYWAERERPEHSIGKHKRHWFNKSSDRQGSGSSPPKSRSASKTPGGSHKSYASSSRGSHMMDDKVGEMDTPGNKLRKGLQFVSPIHPHFTSPTGKPEGLYCKVKREIGSRVMSKPQLVWLKVSVMYKSNFLSS